MELKDILETVSNNVEFNTRSDAEEIGKSMKEFSKQIKNRQTTLVIETNLTIDDKGNIADHQSRIIQVDSWDSYIEEIKTGVTKCRTSYLGNLWGNSLPRYCKVENLVYDELHLSCDVWNYANMLTKKLAYLVD
jgi:hypothetical protein